MLGSTRGIRMARGGDSRGPGRLDFYSRRDRGRGRGPAHRRSADEGLDKRDAAPNTNLPTPDVPGDLTIIISGRRRSCSNRRLLYGRNNTGCRRTYELKTSLSQVSNSVQDYGLVISTESALRAFSIDKSARKNS